MVLQVQGRVGGLWHIAARFFWCDFVIWACLQVGVPSARGWSSILSGVLYKPRSPKGTDNSTKPEAQRVPITPGPSKLESSEIAKGPKGPP